MLQLHHFYMAFSYSWFYSRSSFICYFSRRMNSNRSVYSEISYR